MRVANTKLSHSENVKVCVRFRPTKEERSIVEFEDSDPGSLCSNFLLEDLKKKSGEILKKGIFNSIRFSRNTIHRSMSLNILPKMCLMLFVMDIMDLYWLMAKLELEKPTL